MVDASGTSEHEDPAKELLSQIQRRVRLPPGKTAEDVLAAVMCTFSQHVTGGEARHVFSALPLQLRPLLESCLIHRGEPAERFNRDELLRRVADHLGISPDEAEDITSAVLGVVSERLPTKEVVDVGSQLPADLRGLWMVPRRVPPPVEPHPLLNEIERQIALPPGVTGAGAFAAVMCTLSKRLSRGEARHLVQSLPPDLRPLVQGCLERRGEEPDRFHRTEYLRRLATLLKANRSEPIARAVFRVVQQYLHADVIEHVASQLPPDLQDLWLLG